MATITLAPPRLREDLEIRHRDHALAVVLAYDGDGRCGNYNPADPDDQPLLRLRVSQQRNGRWEELGNASVCTSLSLDDDLPVLQAAARLMHQQLAQALGDGRSLCRLVGSLEWMTARDVEAAIR